MLVFEDVGVLALVVVDPERARDAGQLTGAGVPESGTIVTVSAASPRSIKPWCCRTHEPDLPPTEPVKCSMATYPAEPGVAV